MQRQKKAPSVKDGAECRRGELAGHFLDRQKRRKTRICRIGDLGTIFQSQHFDRPNQHLTEPFTTQLSLPVATTDSAYLSMQIFSKLLITRSHPYEEI